jgi:lysophospholipase L1-like esterase
MRVRLLALLSAFALVVLGAVPASATSEGHSYLALGDSVPFGFNPNRALWSNAANFVGYPEIVAQQLNIEDVNAACPGEATGGFLSLTGTDNGCHPYRFLLHAPLHVDYTGTQMAFATNYLSTHHNTRLVTLMLGANDAFLFQKAHPECFAPVPPATCKDLFFGLLSTIQSNLDTIYSELRSTGYTGLIVAVTYYSLIYPDTSSADLLNGPIRAAASAHGAFVASGVEAWRATAMTLGGGSTCAAGLRLPPFPPDPGVLGCDVHPTLLGATLLADAVVSAVASTCPAHSAQGCLNRNRG